MVDTNPTPLPLDIGAKITQSGGKSLNVELYLVWYDNAEER